MACDNFILEWLYCVDNLLVAGIFRDAYSVKYLAVSSSRDIEHCGLESGVAPSRKNIFILCGDSLIPVLHIPDVVEGIAAPYKYFSVCVITHLLYSLNIGGKKHESREKGSFECRIKCRFYYVHECIRQSKNRPAKKARIVVMAANYYTTFRSRIIASEIALAFVSKASMTTALQQMGAPQV